MKGYAMKDFPWPCPKCGASMARTWFKHWCPACGFVWARRIRAYFAWYDMWVGAYYDQEERILYVCLLPCCVIRLELG